MRLFRYLAQAVALITLSIPTADASSQLREPLNYLSLVENPQIHTPGRRVHAYSTFDLTFDLHKRSQHVRLVLEPNHDILHEDAFINYVNPDGTIKYSEKVNREDHKVFQGSSFLVDKDGSSSRVGYARITVRRDGVNPLFEGAFTVLGNHHHVQLTSNYMSTKHILDPDLEILDDEYMAVWRDSDVGRLAQTELRKRSLELSCGADNLAFNSDLGHPIFRDLLKRGESQWGASPVDVLLGKRQSIDGGGQGNGNSAGVNLRSTIGDTSGCPSTRRVALVGVATDCTYAQDFNSTESLRQNLISVVNSASELYQSSFNITLGLRNLTVQDSTCPANGTTATPWNLACSDSADMTQRLNLFSQWRSTQGDSNAYWSLFTKCNSGAEVGLAWLGQLCNHAGTSQQTGGSAQTVAGANVIARTSTEWQVFAHETGHTFGAVHDCDASTCASSNTVSSSQCCPLSQTACNANAAYLMNPYSSPGINTFSPCSIGNICSALGRNSVQSSCLTDNKGVVTITGNQCGNGIVEEGEDCDCGGTEGCAGNTCCDPTTCKFNSGAVCDPSNEGCCTNQCQFSSAGTVCRTSTGTCDPQEVCSGGNGTCPADTTAPDGTGCGSGLQCASGQCTSRDLQCKTVMGSYTQGNDTYACNSQTCTIQCASPDFGSNVCYSLQQNFLDGTPCSGNGHCSNGVCRGGNVGGEIKSWIDDNKTLVIALASALGGLLLLGILGCIIRACRRRKGRTNPAAFRRERRGVHGPQPRREGLWDGPPVPSQMAQQGYGGVPNQWKGPNAPPPVYSYNAPPPGYSHGGPSVRYA